MLVQIFISFIIANFHALFSNLSLANGIEVNASKATISAIHKIYSGCSEYCIADAIGSKKTKTIIIKRLEVTLKLKSMEE